MRLDGKANLAALGELDRVAEQVVGNLADAHRITDKLVRQRLHDVEDEAQPLAFGCRSVKVSDLADRLPQAEGCLLDDQLARLDLREIEDVIDDGLHVHRAAVRQLEVAALVGVQPALGQQVQQAEQSGEGGAQFVAHVRKELAFCPACRLRPGAFLLQGCLRSLAIGNVLAGPHHARQIVRVDGLDREGAPERHAVAALHDDFLADCLAAGEAGRGHRREPTVGVGCCIEAADTEPGHHFRLVAEDRRHLPVDGNDAPVVEVSCVDVGDAHRRGVERRLLDGQCFLVGKAQAFFSPSRTQQGPA